MSEGATGADTYLTNRGSIQHFASGRIAVDADPLILDESRAAYHGLEFYALGVLGPLLSVSRISGLRVAVAASSPHSQTGTLCTTRINGTHPSSASQAIGSSSPRTRRGSQEPHCKQTDPCVGAAITEQLDALASAESHKRICRQQSAAGASLEFYQRRAHRTAQRLADGSAIRSCSTLRDVGKAEIAAAVTIVSFR